MFRTSVMRGTPPRRYLEADGHLQCRTRETFAQVFIEYTQCILNESGNTLNCETHLRT